jgi:ATP-binding cassette, sub-family E, member 1
MVRIAVVDNTKLKDIQIKQHIINICPVNRTGKECIFLDESKKLVIAENLCIGCGICTKPAPDSIHIINLPEELEKEAIHRYSENGFKLYNLPIPIFNKTVGILGVNGIGKSTAIKILAGLIKPNFGKIGTEATYEELIEHFKGTEAQIFFEKLKKEEIVLSYKPQQVESIPNLHKGTVRELLQIIVESQNKNNKNNILKEKNKEKTYDSNKNTFTIEEIAKELEITKVLDSNIDKISGGELQRTAIAATVLKKANLYIFDEPTSYLDIKQRMKISQFIKNLADENTAVMVVEHDLIILDYMTDLIHMMYGKENTYGIVGQPKTTKNGINIYLSGFLKEENVRFRNYHIKFEEKIAEEKKETSELLKWFNIKTKLGKFILNAKEGILNEERVVGVLGENGIGKTTFVKLLADVIKTDQGQINSKEDKLRVAYKPQYVEQDDTPVATILNEAFQRYKNNLIIDLDLEPLMDRTLNELSGGQLQRVAIAATLAKNADIFLLDEPSAYLDVEQRLKISKVIKDMMTIKRKSAIVVDHDLLFIDYLSDELIVFEGIPAELGNVTGPLSMLDGMNLFLEDLNMTFRRDEENHRPRANKLGSQMDQKQKQEGKLYYS